MQCVAATSALRAAPVARAAAPRGSLRLPARPQVLSMVDRGSMRSPTASGRCRQPRPSAPALLACSQAALRSSSLAGLRLEQQALAAKAQRRAAVVVSAADAEAQQLDPLERQGAAGWLPV